MATLPSTAPAKQRDVGALPHPLHLFASTTRSQHYHFGYFEKSSDPLGTAMERLAERTASKLSPSTRILDLGCGMGGTAVALASRGLEVVGIDPCTEAIHFASERLPRSGAVRLLNLGLAEFVQQASPATFDGVVMTEVLPHFSDLTKLLDDCKRLLRAGGQLVVHDLALNARRRTAAVPFHERGALSRAARKAGLEVVSEEDLTPRVYPTLPLLGHIVRTLREDLLLRFAPWHPDAAREIAEFEAQLASLQDGLANGHLSYVGTVLRSTSTS